MLARWTSPLRDARCAFALTIKNRSLRRAQLAFAIAWAGEWAVLVGISVVAFDDGGPAAVGVVAALRTLPGALLAPLAATVADAVRRERVLVAIGLIRAVTLSAAGGVLAIDGPVAGAYVLVMLATIAQTLFRPAHSALLPALCRGAQELTSANLVRGLLDSFATLSGPLAAAVVLQLSGPSLVFVGCGACSVWASLLLLDLRYAPPTRSDRAGLGGLAVLDGFRAIGANRDLMLITLMGTVQTFTRGAFSVLAVVVAIELLDTGAAGVGVLNGAVGAGALIGSLLALLLVRHGRLASWLGVGVALWGLPLAAIAAVPYELAAIALLAAVGVGNALVDVGAFTLPARLADDGVLARVFAGFEGVLTLGVAAGAAVAPIAIHLLGIHGALVVLGAVGPLTVAATWPALRRLDLRMLARDAEIPPLQLAPALKQQPPVRSEPLVAG